MANANTDMIDAQGERGITGPRSLTRLLALFDALSAAPEGLSLAELSIVLGSPKSSLLNLLRPLVSEAYLIHSGGMYRLGPSMFRLASGVLKAWYLPDVVRPFMEKLARQTGESVMLGVMDPGKGLITYVDIVRSPHPVHYQIAAGSVRPMYPSAAGRVLLAFADRAWRQHYLSTVEIEVRTAAPITKASLRREVEQIREQGLETAIDVFTEGLSAVAAPLFDADGNCVACLGIAGPSDRIRPNLKAVQESVREYAAKASKALAEAELPVAGPRRRQLRAA